MKLCQEQMKTTDFAFQIYKQLLRSDLTGEHYNARFHCTRDANNILSKLSILHDDIVLPPLFICSSKDDKLVFSKYITLYAFAVGPIVPIIHGNYQPTRDDLVELYNISLVL